MKMCTCGCKRFEATVRQTTEMDGTLSFEESDDGDMTVDDHEDVVDEEWCPPFVCENCGKEYVSIDAIPDADNQQSE